MRILHAYFKNQFFIVGIKKNRLAKNYVMKLIYASIIVCLFGKCEDRKKITDALQKRHQENVEMISVLCPEKKDAMHCLKMYDIKYRTFEGKKYLYKITYK